MYFITTGISEIVCKCYVSEEIHPSSERTASIFLSCNSVGRDFISWHAKQIPIPPDRSTPLFRKRMSCRNHRGPWLGMDRDSFKTLFVIRSRDDPHVTQAGIDTVYHIIGTPIPDIKINQWIFPVKCCNSLGKKTWRTALNRP